MRLENFKVQSIIIGLLALIFYFNSFFNEDAFDDQLVIVKNEYVQEGFSGIPKIMTTDCYESFFRHEKSGLPLSAARYRPLSIATFAIEQQFMGTVSEENMDNFFKQDVSFNSATPEHEAFINQMHVRHVVNVILYILTCIVLLYFFRYVVFKKEPVLAFISALLFVIHPIHTEVVANVKSRDEILSLLFICATFIFLYKYHERRKIWLLGAGILSYFLACLSKEYALVLVVLLPLSLYIFNKYSIKKSVLAMVPFFVTSAVYLALRYNVVHLKGEATDANILNNPFMLASAGEALATKIAILLSYLRLLIFPHPLSADYSYNAIPYINFSYPIVWLSLMVHACILVAMIILIIKRHFLGFAIACYLFFIALVSNIPADIGTAMGERLVFHSSIGFVMVLAWVIYKVSLSIKPEIIRNRFLIAFILLLIISSGFKTITRNADWKNNYTLFTQDIKTVPKSILVCHNVASSYIVAADEQLNDAEKRQNLLNAIDLLNYCLSIDHNYFSAFVNRGAAWEKLGDIDRAKADIDSAKQIIPAFASLPGIYLEISGRYMQRGWELYGKNGNYSAEINEYVKSISIDSTNADKWYNLGGAYFHNKQYLQALYAWGQCIKIDPNHVKGQRGIQSVRVILGDSGSSAK